MTAAEGVPLSHLTEASGIAAMAWLIPVIPALSAGVLLLFGKRIGKASALVAIVAMAASAILATLVFTFLQAQPEDARTLIHTVATWLDVGPLQVDWSVLVDPLSTVMLLLGAGFP